jgi:DNA-binding IclR family transcriptional regulator
MKQTSDAHVTNTRPGATARVVEKALDILQCLADSDGELGVTELSRQLGIGKSTVHRLLATLQARDLVRPNPRTRAYRLDFGVLVLSTAYLRQSNLTTLALPHLRRLRDATGETASLTVRRGTSRIHLDEVAGIHDLRFSLEVGKSLPLFVGASSKALVAWLPEDELDALIDECGLPQLTAHSITDRGRLKRDLAETRQVGFSVSESERFPGVVSVAAPVRNDRDEVIAAFNVTGPSDRFALARAREVGPLLAAEALDMSKALGWVARQAGGTQTAVVPAGKADG